MFLLFLLTLKLKHKEIQTTAEAMDAYASPDSGITEATLYF